MSNTLSKDEEQEVLLSIRRLLGENIANSDAIPKPRGRDRLLLTSQLRVAGDNVLVLNAHHARAATVADTAVKAGRSAPTLILKDTDAVRAQRSPQRQIPSRRASVEVDARVTALSEKIAALETAIANTPEQWEPDDAGTDAYAGTRLPAMDWPDAPEKDTSARVPPQPQARSTPKAAVAAPSTEAAVDDAALRAVVAALVRSELKGPLGERLTRNIRAMVRHEIQRALAAQQQK